MIKNDKLIQGTQAWLNWRNDSIGASESAAVLSLSPYDTPYGLWCLKTGRSKAKDLNWAMQKGQDLENRIRARFIAETNVDYNSCIGTHPKYKFITASFDGVSDDGLSLLEIKCASEKTYNETKDGKPPIHYWVQCQHQLLVSGGNVCHFFVYNDRCNGYAHFEVKPDLKFQASLVIAIEDFWNNFILKDIAPPLSAFDVKVVDNNVDLKAIARKLIASRKSTDEKAKMMKEEFLLIGGHNKVRCGRVLVSRILGKTGKESLRLTIAREEEVLDA